MKVLHIEAGRHLYGGAAQVLMLLRGLRNFPGEHVLMCPTGAAIASATSDLNVIPTPMAGELDLLSLPRLLKVLRAEQPDIIHVHSRRGADFWSGIGARWAGTPAILSRRVDNPETRWSRRKYRNYQRVIAISAEIARLLVHRERVPAQKVLCIPSAVDCERFRPHNTGKLRQEFNIAQTAPLLAIVAQLIERKGHHILLAALPTVLAQFPDLKLLIFGQGPQRKALEQQCSELKLDKSVIFAGLRNDLPDLLPELDLLVHPAFAEGLGVALLEAAACELPIIAGRAGGIPEIVRDGYNGTLVEPGNVAELAHATVALLQDHGKMSQYGRNGRQLVLSEFSINRMARDTHAVYQKLLGNAE